MTVPAAPEIATLRDALLEDADMQQPWIAVSVASADAALAALDSLEARLRDTETALRFYADPATYEESAEPHPTSYASGVIPIEADNGERARAALAPPAESVKDLGRDASAAGVDGAGHVPGHHEPVGERQGRQPAQGLPERVVVGENGAYWRDFGEFYSMCPVSTDNDPVRVVAVYVLAPPDPPKPEGGT